MLEKDVLVWVVPNCGEPRCNVEFDRHLALHMVREVGKQSEAEEQLQMARGAARALTDKPCCCVGRV